MSKNDERAEWAREALAGFQKRTGVDAGDAICDLLCDIMHLCDRDERLGSFEDALRRGTMHYKAETIGGEE